MRKRMWPFSSFFFFSVFALFVFPFPDFGAIFFYSEETKKQNLVIIQQSEKWMSGREKEFIVKKEECNIYKVFEEEKR